MGITLKTNLLDFAHKETGISKSKLIKVLDEHTGALFDEGHRWKVIKGEKNAKIYELLKPNNPNQETPPNELIQQRIKETVLAH